MTVLNQIDQDVDIDLEKYMDELETSLSKMQTDREKYWPTLSTYPKGNVNHSKLMLTANSLHARVKTERERHYKFIKELRKCQKIIINFQKHFMRDSKMSDLFSELVQQKACTKCGHRFPIPTN